MLLDSRRIRLGNGFRGRDTIVSSAVAYDRLMFATYATSGLGGGRCGGTANDTSRKPIRLDRDA